MADRYADLLTDEDWQAVADDEHHGLAFIPGALKAAVEERIKLRLAALGVSASPGQTVSEQTPRIRKGRKCQP